MSSAISTISREIAILRRTLKSMDRSLQRLGPILRTTMSGTGSASPAQAKRKLNLSPKRLAQLKVQGQYMATIRQLGPKRKTEVRRVLERRGMHAAVVRAQSFLKKKAA